METHPKRGLNPHAAPYFPISASSPPLHQQQTAKEEKRRRGGGFVTWKGRVRFGSNSNTNSSYNNKREMIREKSSSSSTSSNSTYGCTRSVKNWLKKHEVLPLEQGKTTVMIKNVPKQYTRNLLVEFLDEHCMLMNGHEKKAEDDHDTISAFDFVYLPFDFSTKHNKGYAFVNFTSSRAVSRFYQACNYRRWSLFNSPKIREIVTATRQGKEANVKHFEKSMFWCDNDEFLPICFNTPRDGSSSYRVGETIVGSRPSLIPQVR